MTRRLPLKAAALMVVVAGCGGARETVGTPASRAAAASRGANAQAAIESHGTCCHDGCDAAAVIGPTAMPQVVWQVATRDRVIATPIEFEAGVAVGSLDGSLYAVALDGTRIFETATGAPIRASALAADGGVIVANDAGDVLSVQRSGDIAWRTSLGGPVVTAPIVAPQQSYYVAANGIHRLDRAGNILWHQVEATTIYEQPRGTADGGIAYTTIDGRGITLASDGTVVSETPRPPPAEDAPAPPPAAVVDRHGNRYFADRDQGIVGEDRDGGGLFRYSLGANVAGSVLLTSTGTLIVGANDGKLYALR